MPFVKVRAVKRLFFLLTVLPAMVSCEPVRTVYDANGKKVDPDSAMQGGEKDLSSHFEKQFSESFSEQKSEDGVPITRSNRVSSFQKDIDAARKEDKQFTTKSFLGGRGSDLRSVDFAGHKQFSDKRYDAGGRVAYHTDDRPDFMNETHGISPAHRYRSSTDNRYAGESRDLASRDRVYDTNESRYNGAAPNGYVETRRDRTPEPDITDFKDYYRKSIESTKQMLHREN